MPKTRTVEPASGRTLDPADRRYLDLALEQARESLLGVLPNPTVGAVIVKDGRVLGMGRTQPPGGAHAEIMALREAGEAARGADLYVTLEPCSHFGRTPPCADAVIRAGLARVVVGSRDGNPAVSGAGLARLRAAGIAVEADAPGNACDRYYQGYHTWTRLRRPRVSVKVAQTVNGMVAAGDRGRMAISSAEGLAWSRQLRKESDVVLVGGSTLAADDSDLGLHGLPGKEPDRAVLTRRAGFAPGLRFFREDGARTLVFSSAREAALGAPGELLAVSREGLGSAYADALRILGDRGYHRLLVEPGPDLARAILASGAWDSLHVLVSGRFSADGMPGPLCGAWRGAPEMAMTGCRSAGPDMVFEYAPPAGA